MERSMVQISGTMRHKAAGRCDEFTLEKGDLMRIDTRTSPVSIASHGSVLWVTRENDTQDHMLEPYQSVTFLAPGLVVVEALQGGEMRVTMG